jgi:hypothetical protein
MISGRNAGGVSAVRRDYRAGADIPHHLRIGVHGHERPGICWFRRPQEMVRRRATRLLRSRFMIMGRNNHNGHNYPRSWSGPGGLPEIAVPWCGKVKPFGISPLEPALRR